MNKGLYINEAAYIKDVLKLSGGTLNGIINYNTDLSDDFSGNTLITKDYVDTSIGNIDLTSLENEITGNTSEIGSLETELSGEISDRISGDESLTSALSSEISTTDSEVISLDTELSTEISDRISGDSSLETVLNNYSTTLSGLTDTSINTLTEGNLLVYDNNSSKWINTNTINNDLTIIGDLYVSGTTTTINTDDMNISDNIILVNSGETGSGVSLIYAGMEVDRGALDNYRFVLDDTDTNNPLFKIGAIGDYQAVATREDIPNDSGVTYWDSDLNMLNTSTDLIFDGTTLKYGSTISIINDVDIVHKKYVDDEINGIDLTSLENEITGNTSEIGSLETELSGEISTTNSEITSLDTELSTEISNRISGDGSLETELNNYSTTLSGLTDTSISNLQEGDILLYTGGTWVNDSTENADDIYLNLSGGTLTGDLTVETNLIVYDYYYSGDPDTDGSWRWFINVDGDLEFQKRVSGTWTYKNKMT